MRCYISKGYPFQIRKMFHVDSSCEHGKHNFILSQHVFVFRGMNSLHKHNMRLYLWLRGMHTCIWCKSWHSHTVSHIASRFYKLILLLQLHHAYGGPSTISCQLYSKVKKKKKNRHRKNPDSHKVIIFNTKACKIRLYKTFYVFLKTHSLGYVTSECQSWCSSQGRITF